MSGGESLGVMWGACQPLCLTWRGQNHNSSAEKSVPGQAGENGARNTKKTPGQQPWAGWDRMALCSKAHMAPCLLPCWNLDSPSPCFQLCGLSGSEGSNFPWNVQVKMESHLALLHSKRHSWDLAWRSLKGLVVLTFALVYTCIKICD